MIAPSVLFMGRANDTHSQAVLSAIESQTDAITVAWSAGRGARLDPTIKAWQGDFIFCFRSHVIVPSALIGAARVAAVNFHPGPPEYRGTGCVNFALYDDAAAYGCTAHLLAPEIDAGTILDVRRFPIASADGVEELLGRTHETMVTQACEVISRLMNGRSAAVLAAACRDECWSGPVRRARDLDALMELSPGMDAREMARRQRATAYKGWQPRLPATPV